MSCGCVRVDAGAMESLDSLMRYITMSIPSIPYEAGMDFLNQAYIEFAKRSGLLVSHQQLPIQRDVRVYALEAPEGYEVFGLLNLDPKQGYVQFPNVNRWFFLYQDRFRLLGNEYIEFMEAPSRDDIERVLALQLLPTQCATEIPLEISTPFGYGIAMGALANIMEIPNKGWTNPGLAQRKRLEFNRIAQQGRNLHLTNRGAIVPEFKPIRIL